MDDLVIPKLELPFQPEMHEDVLLLNKEVNEWSRKFFSAVLSNEKIDETNLADFAARIYHYGSYERVLAIAKLTTFFFVVDDYCDDQSVEWMLNKRKRMLEIGERDEIVKLEGENWIEASLSDFLQSLSSLGAEEEWKKRLIVTISDWFQIATFELKYKDMKKVPSLAEYLSLRFFSIGADLMADLIEFAANKYLSGKSLSNRMLHACMQPYGNVVVASNDFYSIRKEVQKGDVMNVVLVFQKEYNITMQDAVHKTVEFITEQLQMYHYSKQQLRALYGEEFDFYLRGLESAMRGNCDFCSTSKRY